MGAASLDWLGKSSGVINMGVWLRVWIAAATVLWPGLAQAAWHEARSNHFIIYADMGPGELKQYAERLERFDQAVRYAGLRVHVAHERFVD